jgi:hypothetical protein
VKALKEKTWKAVDGILTDKHCKGLASLNLNQIYADYLTTLMLAKH